MALLRSVCPPGSMAAALRWASGLFCVPLPWASSEVHGQRPVGAGGGPMVGQGLPGLLSFLCPASSLHRSRRSCWNPKVWLGVGEWEGPGACWLGGL